MPGNYLVPVDPRGLVMVTLRAPDGERHVVALACRYLPVDVPGHTRGVGVEVLYDPGHPQPTETYYCQLSDVQRIVLSADNLVAVRPYLGAAHSVAGPGRA